MDVATFECPSCRRRLPFTEEYWDASANMCRPCAAGARIPDDPGTQPQAVQRIVHERSSEAPTVFFTLLGVAFMMSGLYLLLDPGVAIDTSAAGVFASTLPARVVNLQRLTMGETFTIVGAIFLATAWRPR